VPPPFSPPPPPLQEPLNAPLSHSHSLVPTQLAAASDKLSSLCLRPSEFEKDDDSNHHIDFIAAAANVRGLNYTIPVASRHQVKMIAGKIIPAIATTTCAVTGLVCVEFYKLVAKKPLETLRNYWLNLAINTYSCAEPKGPVVKKSVAMDPIMMGPVIAYPENHSRWDKLVIREGRDLTLKELCNYFVEKHDGLEASMITVDGITLYYPGLFAKHVAERGGRGVLEQYNLSKAAAGKVVPLPPTRDYLILDISFNDKDLVDVLTPSVQYFFR